MIRCIPDCFKAAALRGGGAIAAASCARFAGVPSSVVEIASGSTRDRTTMMMAGCPESELTVPVVGLAMNKHTGILIVQKVNLQQRDLSRLLRWDPEMDCRMKSRSCQLTTRYASSKCWPRRVVPPSRLPHLFRQSGFRLWRMVPTSCRDWQRGKDSSSP